MLPTFAYALLYRVKLKERTKIVAGLAEFIFLQVVKAT